MQNDSLESTLQKKEKQNKQNSCAIFLRELKLKSLKARLQELFFKKVS